MTWIEMRLSMSHPYFPLGPRDPTISKVLDVTPDRRGSATRPVIKVCERGSCLGSVYASRFWGSETRQASRVRRLVLSNSAWIACGLMKLWSVVQRWHAVSSNFGVALGLGYLSPLLMHVCSVEEIRMCDILSMT